MTLLYELKVVATRGPLGHDEQWRQLKDESLFKTLDNDVSNGY